MNANKYIYVHIYTDIHVCIYTYTYIYIYVYIYVHLCVYVQEEGEIYDLQGHERRWCISIHIYVSTFFVNPSTILCMYTLIYIRIH